MSECPCPACGGRRLKKEVLAVTVGGKSIHEVCEMSALDCYRFFRDLHFDGQQGAIANPIAKEIVARLKFLVDVGLDYLTLERATATLSGGEAQRIKLSKELSRKATGRTLYILDEPTTGLHFEDINRLLSVLHQLVEQGNTVVVIEHNLDVIKTADYIIDIGPEGGDGGGKIIAKGTPEEVAKSPISYTAKYLKSKLS